MTSEISDPLSFSDLRRISGEAVSLDTDPPLLASLRRKMLKYIRLVHAGQPQSGQCMAY